MKLVTKTITVYDCGSQNCGHISEAKALKCAKLTFKHLEISLVNSIILKLFLNSRLSTKALAEKYKISKSRTVRERLRRCVDEIVEMLDKEDVTLYDITKSFTAMTKWNSYNRQYTKVISTQIEHFKDNILNGETI